MVMPDPKMLNPWTITGRRNEHFAGYTVVVNAALDESLLKDRLKPGPFELIHCSSVETAQAIADWLNGDG
jgi:hypothetical protein